ncbi:hypothetical protein [Alloactinosynnema sp. L-07]|uniref:hypothetical protein n=1 Tax=Alloactinosynnema sp. L-07 TaxID=1653480 RepID=UPI00065F0920|nr:hypothetical protein [Alloactinosynnema sp. L-07]CRK59920.1 hypothetical protein [Alloactinosynnema sp. L-07]
MASGRDTAQDEPGQGRHRRGSGTTGWTPRLRPRRPQPPREDDTDVLPVIAGLFPDAPATGLAKFDLGSIPASVTPPRSWRRAAGFAVAASILVLVGLLYAASTLVTGPRRPEIVDALPGLPSGPEMPIELPGEPLMSQRPAPSSAAPSTSASRTQPKRTTDRPRQPGPSAPGSTDQPTPTSSTVAATTTTTPTRTTVETPVLIGPVVDAKTIGDRTETYFSAVANDPDSAFAMTTGQARRDGEDEIQRRYADVTRVEVQKMTIDKNRSTTRSVLRVYRDDGTISTEERELTFTYGTNPKITQDIGTG